MSIDSLLTRFSLMLRSGLIGDIGTRIMDKGGLVRILKLLEQHYSDVLIQQRGCGVLSLLSAIR